MKTPVIIPDIRHAAGAAGLAVQQLVRHLQRANHRLHIHIVEQLRIEACGRDVVIQTLRGARDNSPPRPKVSRCVGAAVPVVVHNTSKPRHGADRNQGAVPAFNTEAQIVGREPRGVALQAADGLLVLGDKASLVRLPAVVDVSVRIRVYLLRPNIVYGLHFTSSEASTCPYIWIYC